MEAVGELDRLLAVSQVILHRQSLLCGGLPAEGAPTAVQLCATHHRVREGQPRPLYLSDLLLTRAGLCSSPDTSRAAFRPGLRSRSSER